MSTTEILRGLQTVKESLAHRINAPLRWLEKLPFSIRTKITAPYLALAVLLAVAGGFMITRIVLDTVEERFANQLIEAGKLASERMVVEENRLLSTLRMLTHTEGVSQALEENDPEALRALTFGSIVNQQEEAVEFLDPSGYPLLSIHHRPDGRIEDYSFSSGGEQIRWDFVERVLAQNVDEQGDKFSGFARAGWGNYFYVAGPVYNQQGKFVGVILVGKTANTLARKIREETLAQITLYDHNGVVQASTFIDPLDLPVELARQTLANQDSNSFRRGLNVQSIQYQEITAAWEARDYSDLGVIGVSLSNSFLVNTTRVTRIQMTVLVMLMFLIVILVGMSLANAITRPISNLVQASEQVSRGNLNVMVPSTGGDEISLLSQTFNLMVSNLEESKDDLIKSYDRTLEGWSRALELRDRETQGHSMRVTKLTIMMAQALGMDAGRIEHMRRGAMLHDIGKMGIPDSILLKAGKLTPEETRVMQNHTIYAYEMLNHIEFLQPAVAIPYCHHEWWDGSGYPRGLKGEEIPLEARIFSIVDSWDALNSDRPYRDAMQRKDAVKTIEAEVGTHFDPEMAKVFFQLIQTDSV